MSKPIVIKENQDFEINGNIMYWTFNGYQTVLNMRTHVPKPTKITVTKSKTKNK